MNDAINHHFYLKKKNGMQGVNDQDEFMSVDVSVVVDVVYFVLAASKVGVYNHN